MSVPIFFAVSLESLAACVCSCHFISHTFCLCPSPFQSAFDPFIYLSISIYVASCHSLSVFTLHSVTSLFFPSYPQVVTHLQPGRSNHRFNDTHVEKCLNFTVLLSACIKLRAEKYCNFESKYSTLSNHWLLQFKMNLDSWLTFFWGHSVYVCVCMSAWLSTRSSRYLIS